MYCYLLINSVSNSNDALVTQSTVTILQLNDVGHIVQFMWITSHIGRLYAANQLANEALKKDSINSQATMNFRRIKGILISRRKQWECENIAKIIDSGSESMKHYVTVNDNTNVSYGRISTRVNTVIMRIRLGYKNIVGST